MNIFILSEEVDFHRHMQQQAEFHADRHVVKMITESVQMLVTACTSAHHFLSVPDALYDKRPCQRLAPGHSKHPCAIWTNASTQNFNYLAVLALELCREHQHRYPLSAEHMYMPWLVELVGWLTDNELGYHTKQVPKSFAIAVKDVKKRSNAELHAVACAIYRDYYVADKYSFATWKRRAKPIWFLMREEEMIANKAMKQSKRI